MKLFGIFKDTEDETIVNKYAVPTVIRNDELGVTSDDIIFCLDVSKLDQIRIGLHVQRARVISRLQYLNRSPQGDTAVLNAKNFKANLAIFEDLIKSRKAELKKMHHEKNSKSQQNTLIQMLKKEVGENRFLEIVEMSNKIENYNASQECE